MTEILIRTVLAFSVLLLLARVLGKKQLSQVTYFNYVTGITIGSIAAAISIDRKISILDGLLALALWTLLSILTGFLNMKSSRARVLLDGEPTILIKKGRINRPALTSQRLNMDDLSMLLRKERVFSLAEVNYAILEPDGKMSILLKGEYQPPTRKDLSLQTPPAKYLPSEIIVDGRLVEKNLPELNLDLQWVKKELQNQGYQDIDQIFYAELQQDGSLFIEPLQSG